MNRRVALMSIAILILFLLLGTLFYYYILLIRPPRPIAAPPRIKGIEHVFSIYGYGKKPGERLEKPHGIAVDKEKNIYVVDSNHHRILIFNQNGRLLSKLGKKGSSPGEMVFPVGVAVAPNGNIYITDKIQNKILIFSPDHQLLGEIQQLRPLIPTVANGKLYVTTRSNVLIYDLDGNLINTWGKRGKAPGEFDHPNGIAVAKDGTVYVSDGNNMRLQALDKDGNVIWVVGEPPKTMFETTRRFGLPMGLTFDNKENLYLVDSFHGSIRVFTRQGKELGEVGDLGAQEGQFQYPAGIAYLGESTFAITDKYNDRVQVLRIAPPEEVAAEKEATPEEEATPGEKKTSPWMLSLFGIGLLLLFLVLFLFLISSRRRRKAEQ